MTSNLRFFLNPSLTVSQWIAKIQVVMSKKKGLSKSSLSEPEKFPDGLFFEICLHSAGEKENVQWKGSLIPYELIMIKFIGLAFTCLVSKEFKKMHLETLNFLFVADSSIDEQQSGVRKQKEKTKHQLSGVRCTVSTFSVGQF